MPTLEGQEANLAGQQVRFTFLHTSDIHSRLIPYDFLPNTSDVSLGLIPPAGPFGGATRVAAILKRERTRADRVIHLDSGDSFQGAPIFNLNKGEAEFKFLSSVKLDAAVLGNHEFDAGAANFIQKTRDFATFPVLAANYYWDDPRNVDNNKGSQVTSPYTIKTLNGVRVGIVGMANESTVTSLVEGGNSIQATPLEQNESCRDYVDFLRPLVDVIVVVSHLGLSEDQDIVQGYDAFFEYGRIKSFINRGNNPWKIVQWFGPEGQEKSVVQVRVPGVSGIDIIFGGHLHVVLNPPQLLTDPSGRKVLLSHSGAFAKFVGRLDVVLQMPDKRGTADGAEILSNTYKVIPVDALWCDDALHAEYAVKGSSFSEGQFIRRDDVRAAIAKCTDQEDRETTQLLQPYILGMDYNLSLASIFAYAPADIARRNDSTGGDSPLGNVCADSMRKRTTVDAEMALTNSLGIRDNLYAGPLTQEAMFNVFPFENTINIMYLGGDDMQEMFDFVTDRSAERACVSQAQISGGRFTMDCAQSQLNKLRLACDGNRSGADNGTDCPQESREGRNPWQCIKDEQGVGRCYAHPAEAIYINGELLQRTRSYKIAVNDYIAQGGSGFRVLKRNTTRIETGISLRDSIVGFVQSFCTCDDILKGKSQSASGTYCGVLTNGHYVIEEGMKTSCQSARDFETALKAPAGNATCLQVLTGDLARLGVTEISAQMLTACTQLPGPKLAKCSCVDALQTKDDTQSVCGHITQQVRNFCGRPTSIALATAREDGRIARRVK